MLNKIKSLHLLFAFMAVILIAGAPRASAQVTPTQQIVLVTSTNTVAPSGTATVTSQAFTPNAASGFGVMSNVVTGTGAGTTSGTVTFGFQVSLDGTNWTTTYPIKTTTVSTGTTPAIDYYSVPTLVTGSGCAVAPFVRLGQVINSGTSGTLTIGSLTIILRNR